MEEAKKYFKRLDFIRVLACVMVVLYHLSIIGGGFLAVCTFFALSGYLQCLSAMKSKTFSIKKYYLKRLKRIYLPLLLVVSITVIYAKLNPNINWLNLKQETISALFGYNNFWQLNANMDYFTKNINSPLIHIWYISILMQFDLVFPIFFLLFKKINKLIYKNASTIIIFLLAVISTIGFFYMSKTQSIMSVYYNTFTRSFSIIWGIFLALLHYKHNIKLSNLFKKDNTKIFVLYTAILSVLCIFLPDNQNYYGIFMIIATIISCRIIEYATMKAVKKDKTASIINYLAQISYEVYLVHYPIMYFTQNMGINSSIRIPLIIILTMIVSVILHHLLNTSVKNKIYRDIKILIMIIIVTIGSFLIIIEKDHTKEMNELQHNLNEK